MNGRRVLLMSVMLACVVGLVTVAGAAAPLTNEEELGKMLFFDEDLSLNGNQSCATCHAPAVGWVGPDSAVNAAGAVYEGSVPGAFGDRKPPTAAYGGHSPVLYYDAIEEVWVGGMFWDGRATGWVLGDPLAEQAKGPFLNPKEQALPSAEALVEKVRMASYAPLFEAVWGPGSLDDADSAYDLIGRSIAAYERSVEVSPYSSKYDAYLAGTAKLSGAERRGMDLFFGKALCSACHNGADFTDFTYDNLGVPKNPMNPMYAEHPDFIDPGLGGFLKSTGYDEGVYQAEWGKHKVPSLRNVAMRPSPRGLSVKAYGHNGYFKSLKEIVHFYNTRDVMGAGWKGAPWPAAEYADTVNVDELGDLGLTDREEDDLVAFMEALSDGWMP